MNAGATANVRQFQDIFEIKFDEWEKSVKFSRKQIIVKGFWAVVFTMLILRNNLHKDKCDRWKMALIYAKEDEIYKRL